MSDITPKQGLGCILAVITFFITIPIWYVLLFAILQRVDAAPWMWVAYWIYIPVGIIGHVVVKMIQYSSD